MASALLKQPVEVTDRNLCYFGAFIYALQLVDEKARERGVWKEIKNQDGRVVDVLPDIPYRKLCEVVRVVGDRCCLLNHLSTGTRVNSSPQ